MIREITYERKQLTRQEYRILNELFSLGYITKFENENDMVNVVIEEIDMIKELTSEQANLLIKIDAFKMEEIEAKIIKEKESINTNIKVNLNTNLSLLDFVKYEFDFKRMKENSISKTGAHLKVILEKLINESSLEESYLIFNASIKNDIKESKIPKKIRLMAQKYISSIENEVNHIFYDYKLSNGNVIKIADYIDFETITKCITNITDNTINANKFPFLNELADKVILVSDEGFKFNTKIKNEPLYKFLMKIKYSECQIINDLEEVKGYIHNFVEGNSSLRAVESNIIRYELLISLGYGKYKVLIGENENIENQRLKLATETKELLDEYFDDENNHIIDMIYISDQIISNEYDYYNEHELFYLARKYVNDFSECYWSYRPPLVFRTSEKGNEKNVTKILAKHIKAFVEKKNIVDQWIEKDDFLNMLFNSSGIKESNFIQKINELETYGIEIFSEDGNRYRKGQFKICFK